VHPVLNNFIAGVLVGPDPVDVFTGLLGGVFVFGVTRLKADVVLAGCKDFHKARHDEANGVGYVPAYDLALVLDLIAERLAVVVVGRLIPKPGMLLLLIEDSVIDLVLHDPMDFGVIKFGHVSALFAPLWLVASGIGCAGLFCRACLGFVCLAATAPTVAAFGFLDGHLYFRVV